MAGYVPGDTVMPIPSAIVKAHRLLWRHGLAPARKDFHPVANVVRYVEFWRDWRAYSRLPGAETLNIADSFPRLDDATQLTGIETHYFYQSVWLAQRLAASRPTLHVDVGSDHRMVGMLTSHSKIVFVEIRPLAATVDSLVPITGSIVQLPLRDRSVRSMSCLHVAEHVGLGRYGDKMDPNGTRRSAEELGRALAPGGNLYFSVPVGRPRTEFNAHRVHTPLQVRAMFPDLELVAFSAEDDAGRFHAHAEPTDFEHASYACGMFWFRRPEELG